MENENVTESASGNAAGHHQEGISSLALPLLNFAVFLGILVFVYKKKVQPLLVLRAQSYKATESKVREAEVKFQAELESLQYQLAKIEEEELQVTASFKEQGVRSAETLTRQGLEEIAQLQNETALTKQNLINQLESDIRSEIMSRALKISAERLAQALTPEMDKSLRGKVLEAL